MDNKNVMDIDLTIVSEKFEMASRYDADLMRIKCFATHEGKNLNGTIFPRENLMLAYRTFIDKPVIIVPNKSNDPTTHGFNFKSGQFDINKRKNIGHIVDAYPVIVNTNNEIIEVYDAENAKNFPEGELRIVAELVIYKNYLSDIAERLEFLHSIGNLSFSMEALVSGVPTDDGGKVCTDITFTGLAIVDTPAFVNSKSISVAEKEEEQMELQEKYDALVAEKAVVDSKLEETTNELASIKEELAETKAELATEKTAKESVIAELTPYKEKVEAAEKEALGKSRAEKLAKLGVNKEVAELAELDKESFADMLIEAAENFKPEVAEVVTDEIHGANFHDTKLSDNDFDELNKALAELTK